MKKSLLQLLMMVWALLLTSCSASFYAASNGASNDLYAIHNRTEIARKQQAEAEARKAEAEARKAEFEALIAEREAQQLSSQASSVASSGVNYQSVLADDYESAYARRLRGFESPSYRMPSSYTNARYSSTFHYVSAYDPAFYNIIVMGDEVWVEPKYVTAMFGSWGRPVYQSAWYYGWSVPSFSIGWGSWGWNIGLSWYDPWFFPSWHNPWWGWHGPHWWGHGPYHPHWYPGWHAGGYRPIYGGHHHHRPGHGVVHRPSASRYTRPYGGSSRNAVNRAQEGNRNWSSGVYQGGSSGGNRTGSGSVSRQPNSNNNRNSYNSNSSWGTNNSTRRSSSSGYSGSSSSYGGSRSSGSSGSSSSSGSRGGYSGSSSRGR